MAWTSSDDTESGLSALAALCDSIPRMVIEGTLLIGVM
jgi:hypothetical protein